MAFNTPQYPNKVLFVEKTLFTVFQILGVTDGTRRDGRDIHFKGLPKINCDVKIMFESLSMFLFQQTKKLLNLQEIDMGYREL